MVWHFLLQSVPWWGWLIVIGAIYAGVLFLVGTLFGWALARKLAWPLLAIGGAMIFLLRARQAGYADRKAEEDAEARKAETIVENERKDTRDDTDANLDGKTDRWTRR